MQKQLKISVSKNPVDDAIVNCRTVSIKQKLFNKLFGKKATMTIIVPGNSVKSIEIMDADMEDRANDSK